MSPFRTVEVSDPRFEHEGLRTVTVRSRYLPGRGDVSVYVPPGIHRGQDVPLVILLHGVYGSHWSWALKGGAHRIAARLIQSGELPPVVVAMPSDGLWGDGSGYVGQGRYDWERWIIEEVPAAAAEATSALGPTSPWFLGGLSMGGFGALRLGARHPDRLRAVSGLSSVTHLDQLRGFLAEEPGWDSSTIEDPGVLKAWLRASHRPAMRFDCGTEDPLLEANRELHRGLMAAGIGHQYFEHPGGHTWEYWERRLPDTLRFFAQHLPPSTTQPRLSGS